MTTLNGKIALVTGASRGLGRAIAERFGRLGATVVVNYASSAKAAQECVAAIESSGGKALAVKADVANVAEIRSLFGEARRAFGRIDIAVANAGIEVVGVSALEFTEEQFWTIQIVREVSAHSRGIRAFVLDAAPVKAGEV
jgi:3-oxoacyl-[acyl-carrier protein] reductase